MRFAKLFFAAPLLSESIVVSYAPAGANEIPGLTSKDEPFVADGYCGDNQQPIVKRRIPTESSTITVRAATLACGKVTRTCGGWIPYRWEDYYQ